MQVEKKSNYTENTSILCSSSSSNVCFLMEFLSIFLCSEIKSYNILILFITFVSYLDGKKAKELLKRIC